MIKNRTQVVSSENNNSEEYKELKVGFILFNHFTLISVAGMLDGLRFASDSSFNSQQKMCYWQLMTLDNQPVMASCGMQVVPTANLDLDEDWDYIVIAGGLLEETRYPPTWLLKKIRALAKVNRKFISLCSGIFVLAKAGLLNDKACAIHFTTIDEFKYRFPRTKPFVESHYHQDGNIFTCPGGAAFDLISELISKHCGIQRANKTLRYLLTTSFEKNTTGEKATSKSKVYTEIYNNNLVTEIIDYLTSHLSEPISEDIISNLTTVSLRKVNQEFVKSTGLTLNAYWRKLKIEKARKLLSESDASITIIAKDCGFTNASHLIKWFKKSFGETPGDYRQRTRHIERLT